MQRTKVCVIGPGTMGSGIAAHLANIGFDVTLLGPTRDFTAEAWRKATSLRPPHLMLPGTAETVRLGGMDTDLDAISSADWVCEAIFEKLDAKRDLFGQIEPLLREDAFISTNTSGLQIELLKEGRSDSFRRRFLGTHFFNPPRYLKLLELIPTPETDPTVIEGITRFLEDKAARRVVLAKDTPGFIANRYGMWSMFWATHVAERLQLTIEEVDEITGPFLGRPKSGSFRLNDLVGLDIMVDIAQNLMDRCPYDPGTAQLVNPNSLAYLLDKGWIGNKAGQGYYKKENNQFLSFDLIGHGYRERREPDLPTLKELGRLPLGERIRTALTRHEQVGDYLREYLVPTLQYAESIREEISHHAQDFDRVMRWGFGWEMGPFEMIDAIGPAALGMADRRYYQAGQVLGPNGVYLTPPAEPQYRPLSDFPVLDTRPGLEIRDLGDGVQAVATTTKMGTITPEVVESLIGLVEGGTLDRFVFTSAARVFSFGFDLKFFESAIAEERFDDIDHAIARFQHLNTILQGTRSVAAIHGFALGGGLEIAMACARIIAAADAQIGLPEAKVGLIPGGAGTAVLRRRSQPGAKEACTAVRTLTLGQVATNADEARTLGYLTRDDVTAYHPDRLLHDAKQLAFKVEPGPETPWQPLVGPFRSMVDTMQADLQEKKLSTEYDEIISDHLKHCFDKSTSWEDALTHERERFVALCREGRTLARIRHMLETGKPLRN